MRISFPTHGQFDLVVAVLAQTYQPEDAGDPKTCSVQVTDPDLALLLQRVVTGAVTVLPSWQSLYDRWRLAADSRHVAERALLHVSRFVLPSYGSLPANVGFASYHSFMEPDSSLQVAVHAGYEGFFEWHTSPVQRAVVLRRLGLWARLEEACPPLTLERFPSYAELFAEFQSALAAANWVAGEKILADMQRLHLSTFDNLQFLRFELLARRGEWNSVWSDPIFPVLAAGPTPRSVRAAILAAFHQSVLLHAEQSDDFDTALTRFREAQPRLGTLLTGRFSLTDSAVVRIFAYRAATERDRETLDELLTSAPLDDNARNVVVALRDRIPPLQTELPPLPADRLRRAMQLRDYDRAVQAANELADPVERTLALLRIALRHPDAASIALTAFDTLSLEKQKQLYEEEPLADQYLERILGVTHSPRPEICTWPDWFERLIADPRDAGLEAAIDTLRQSLDDRSWPQEICHATRVSLERILTENTALFAARVVKRAVAAVADLLLGDKQFPYTDDAYADLYDTLLYCLVFTHDVNENEGRKLLRLMDAQLRRQSSKVGTVATDIQDWFDHPSPVMESLLLDGFDLLINYGAERQAIFDPYRKWLSHLLDLPTTVTWDRSSQEVWLSIGEWLQPGDDLLLPLRQRLETATATVADDPLDNLPPGYRIAIFTLNPSAARRAIEVIKRRNTQVEIAICDAIVLTGTASHLASWADVAVIVSTCLTHAVFYGIKPYLRRNPIFPSFQGATSILRAVEEFANSVKL
jgi:hypothetical protein